MAMDLKPPTDTVGAYCSPCVEQIEPRWCEETDNLINRLENWGLAHSAQLEKRLAQQEDTLRSAINMTVSEQMGPLIVQIQVLIDLIGRRHKFQRHCDRTSMSSADSHAQPQVNESESTDMWCSEPIQEEEPVSLERHISQTSERHHFHSERVCSVVSATLREIGRPLRQRVSMAIQKSATLYTRNGGRSCLDSIVENPCFTGIIGVVVILNSLFIGAQAHEHFKRLSATTTGTTTEQSLLFKRINQVFACIFVAELSFRLLAHRLRFFTGDNWKWNIFDAILVCTSALDELLQTGVNFSASRVLRVFRMARVLRIVRVVESFRELREMMCSILGSLKSVCWAITLLAIIMYLFAVLFMQGAIACVEQDGAQPDEFVAYFGSVDSTMYSLLLAISGGRDWGDMVQPFDSYSRWFRLYFSIYIVLVVIGVLNILTGVFVSRAAEASALDQDLVLQAELTNTRTVARTIHKMFQEMDVEISGTIHIDQLKEYTSRPNVQAYLSVLHLDSADCQRLISLLKYDTHGFVSMEEFIACCLRYRGNLRSIEVAVILREQSKQSARLHDLAKKSDEFMHNISEKVDCLLDRAT